jgi:hypothetical protein
VRYHSRRRNARRYLFVPCLASLLLELELTLPLPVEQGTPATVVFPCPASLSSPSSVPSLLLSTAGSSSFLSPHLSFSLNPLSRSYIDQAIGWRWIQWIHMIANGVLLIAEIILLRETRGAKILLERAKKMRFVLSLSSFFPDVY